MSEYQEFTGKSAMTLEFPGMENMEGMPPMTVDFRVAFKAPEEFKIEASTDNPMLAQQTGSLKAQVEHLLRAGQGQMKPMQEEFDADLEEKDGKKTLVVTMYQNSAKAGTMRMALDGNGLPEKGAMTVSNPQMGEMQIDLGFHYAKVGERFRIERQTMANSMMPGEMETKMTYADAGGFDVMTSFVISGVMGSGTMSFRYSELAVNGKKVEVPAATKAAEPAAPAAPATPAPPAVPPVEKKSE